MNKACLSVCIPTYNRDQCLRQCLKSITSQFGSAEVGEGVEVVISDNASGDSTAGVVKEFSDKFGNNIVYIKNSENLGYDRNALQVIDRAKGEFVWLLGDDDALFPGALEHVLELIKHGKFEYCIANCWGYDKALLAPALNRPNLSIKTDQYFPNLAAFVRTLDYQDLVGYFGGMSSQIFKRQIWQALPGKEKFIGTHTIHLFILLSAFKEKKFALLAKPLVKGRADNMRWEIFPGLLTSTERARSSHKALLWILDQYDLPYSKVLLQVKFYRSVTLNSLNFFLRRHLFKNQKLRDKLKKILGKL